MLEAFPINRSAREGYQRTLHDLETSLSCSQCRASELMTAIKGEHGAYSRGQRMACWDILQHEHSCGATANAASGVIPMLEASQHPVSTTIGQKYGPKLEAELMLILDQYEQERGFVRHMIVGELRKLLAGKSTGLVESLANHVLDAHGTDTFEQIVTRMMG